MNTFSHPLSSRRIHSRGGFTLAEVLVSSVLIVIILGLLLSTVNQTQKIWSRTTTKVAQFQAARAAFDVMSRRLSQATLNTYWKAYDANQDAEKEDLYFTRKAELQFLTGPTSVIFNNPKISDVQGELSKVFPTHSMFFHAPLGYTEEQVLANKGDASQDSLKFRGLNNMLSGAGYFVEFSAEERPAFMLNDEITYPPKYRFRLKELNVPAEMLTVFRRPDQSPSNELTYSIEQFVLQEDGSKMSQTDLTKIYQGLVDDRRKIRNGFIRPDWMKVALFRDRVENQPRFRFARTLADNVVALIILPKYAEKDRTQADRLDDLAPDYAYDSWRIVPPKKGLPANTTRQFPVRDCVLPPIVQVTMVAIDEQSAQRADADLSNVPTWTEGLFTTVSSETDFRAEVEKLEKKLRADPSKPNYRIFNTDVVIRGAKWSRFN